MTTNTLGTNPQSVPGGKSLVSAKTIVLSVIAIAVIAAVVLYLINSASPANTIVGSWQQRGGGEVDQFYQDGTVTATVYGVSYVGTYTFIDDHTLKISIQGMFGTSAGVLDVRVNGNTMTLTTSAGMSVQYDRVGEFKLFGNITNSL